MICDEARVGDMEGDDEAEAAPRSPDDILRTNLCCSLTSPRGLKSVLAVLGVSGAVKGVGNPPEDTPSPFSDSCGLEGVEVLSRFAARFLIMHMSESALEIFCNLLLLPPFPEIFAAVAAAATAD